MAAQKLNWGHTNETRGEGARERREKNYLLPSQPPAPPPSASPPWHRFSFRTVYFLPYETQAKNTPEKNRLRRLTHTTNLIRVRVGFLWVWLLLRRTFFVCFSPFSFLLHIFNLFSTLFMWINLVLLFLRLSSLTKSLPISSSAGERRQVRLPWPAIVSCAFLSCRLLSAWATSLLCPQLTSLLPHSI